MTITRTFTNGDDIYSTNAEDDYDLRFLAGVDRLTTWRGLVAASMGSGDDLVAIRGGDLTAFGDEGADRFNILADLVSVELHGGSGSDSFFGYWHAVAGTVSGDAGADAFYSFVSSPGVSLTLAGGGGDDLYRVDPSCAPRLLENAGEGVDTVELMSGRNYTLGANVENMRLIDVAGGTGGSTLRGNGLNNVITGDGGADTLYGLEGDDFLRGGAGDDLFWGGNGNDRLDGGAGNDELHGQGGNDILEGRTGDDLMIGGIGDDLYFVDSREDSVVEDLGGGLDAVRSSAQLYYLPDQVEIGIAIGGARADIIGNALDNILTGSAGTNILDGGAGNDVLRGAGGVDRLEGGSGNDTLLGGDGFDQMYGEAGDDILIGGLGTDRYYGGGGNDLYILQSAGPSNTPNYINVDSAGDRLDLSRIDADVTQDGDQAFHLASSLSGQAGELWIDPTLHDLIDEFGDVMFEGYYQDIYGDTDGDGVADLIIRTENADIMQVQAGMIIF